MSLAIDSRWSDQLVDGLKTMQVVLSQTQRDMLLRYLALLAKWNRAYNLTAVRDPAQVVTRHLLDSLSTLAHVQGPRIIDVGTGAGLPGVPLAIARPDWQVCLLDSNGKKTRFLNQATVELALPNVTVINQRVESYRAEQSFDTIVSRAFAALPDMLRITRHLRAPGGQWLAMKGPGEHAERVALSPEFKVEVHTVEIPGECIERRVLILRQS